MPYYNIKCHNANTNTGIGFKYFTFYKIFDLFSKKSIIKSTCFFEFWAFLKEVL